MNTGIKLRDFAIALVVLAVLALIVYLVMFCYRVKYPRPFFLFSSVNLKRSMEDIYKNMNMLYARIKDVPTPPVALPLTIKFIDDIIVTQDPKSRAPIQTKPAAPLSPCEDNSTPAECLGPDGAVDPNKLGDPKCRAASTQPRGVPHDGTGETKFEIYLTFDHILKSKADKFIYRRIMKAFRTYSQCGTDNAAGLTTLEGIIVEVEAVKSELEQAMSALDEFEKEFPADQAAAWVDFCVSVRKMHFYFHHGGEQLKEMYDIRRFSLFNFLVVLVRPYVDKLIIKEVYMRWVDVFSWSTINESYKSFEEWWKWLGYGTGEDDAWPGLMPNRMVPAFIDFSFNKVVNMV